MYYCGFTYTEAMNLPVIYKRWFIDRTVKEINKGSEDGGNHSRAAHHNTPQTRELMGVTRSQTPSRLRRFS